MRALCRRQCDLLSSPCTQCLEEVEIYSHSWEWTWSEQTAYVSPHPLTPRTVKCFGHSTISVKEVAGIAFLFPTSHRSVWTGSIHCSSRCTWHCHSDHRQGLGSVAWEAPVPLAPWHSPTVGADWGAGTPGTGHHFCRPGCFYTKPHHTVSSGYSVLLAAHLCAALFSWKIIKHIVSRCAGSTNSFSFPFYSARGLYR